MNDNSSFSVTMFSSDSYEIKGKWVLNIEEEEGDTAQSPNISFFNTNIRFTIPIRESNSKFIMNLDLETKETNYEAAVSISLGTYHPKYNLVFTPGTSRAILNFSASRSQVISSIQGRVWTIYINLIHNKSERSNLDGEYVGLLNQGATCYMNSYLQALYHIPYFRSIIYKMNAESSGIALNLQKLFYSMQTSSRVVSTKDLTNSFGWNNYDIFIQHDIEEFSRVLLENLELKLKGTNQENEIAYLFRGKLRQLISCPQIGYQTSNEQQFYDLQLEVKDMNNLENSIRKFLSVQKLEGDNQYETPNEGKQNAEIKLEFVELPNVLQIHLRRFEYVPVKNIQVKIQDRFEFPSKIDLGKYVQQESCKYQLFGVLVHSGVAQSGHYYAFLRPTPKSSWYKFNDSSVEMSTMKEAIDDNFGSPNMKSSGYLLMYVKEDMIPKLFVNPETPKDIFINNKTNTSDSNEIIENVVTDYDLKRDCSPLGLKSRHSSLTLKLQYGVPFKEVKKMITSYYGVSEDNIDLWTCGSDGVPYQSYNDLDEMEITHSSCVYSRIGKKISKDENTLVFLKFYFPNEKSPIQFLTSYIAEKKLSIPSLKVFVNSILGFNENTPLIAFKEMMGRSIEEVDGTIELANTIILIFQQVPGTELNHTCWEIENYNLELPPISDDAIDCSKLLSIENKNTVKEYLEKFFKTSEAFISSYESPDNKLFKLRFCNSLETEKLKQAIAQASNINYNPEEQTMLLFSKYIKDDEPNKIPITTKLIGAQTRLFFKIFDGLSSQQANDSITVSLKIDGSSELILMPRQSTFKDLADKYDGKYTITSVTNGSIKIIDLSLKILTSSQEYHLVEAPEIKDDEENLICVCHTENIKTFDPFLFVVKAGEQFINAKMRLKEIIKVTDEEFDEYKFTCEENHVNYFPPTSHDDVEDEAELFDIMKAKSIYLKVSKKNINSVTKNTFSNRTNAGIVIKS